MSRFHRGFKDRWHAAVRLRLRVEEKYPPDHWLAKWAECIEAYQFQRFLGGETVMNKIYFIWCGAKFWLWYNREVIGTFYVEDITNDGVHSLVRLLRNAGKALNGYDTITLEISVAEELGFDTHSGQVAELLLENPGILDAATEFDYVGSSGEREVNRNEVGLGEAVRCASCGAWFNNWENGFFFPSGDSATIPANMTDVHYCNNCGSDIAEQYGWFEGK